MRTYQMGVNDVASKSAQYGNVASFTYGVATEDNKSYRGVYTFDSGKVVSFKVPLEDLEYLKAITDTVSKSTGANTTAFEESVTNLFGKFKETVKGIPIISTVADWGVIPFVVIIGVVIGIGVFVVKKLKRRKKGKKRRR